MNDKPVCHITSKRGFTMMEVLVAILIFSFGMLGLAGLMTVSMKTNHGAYLRSQAVFLAQSLADRMRSNPIGVWGSAGTSSYAFTAANPVTASNQDCNAATCSPAQVAVHDLYAWNQQLVDFLPPPPSGNPAVVACGLRTTGPVPATATTPAQLLQKPPYDGSCTITINWTETTLNPGESSAAASTVLQTFTLAFQP